MKKLLLIVFIASLLVACHSDLNLKDIDTTAQAEMGIALHVGSVRAKLGNFVGYVDGLYVDSAKGGVITWRDTFPDSREYHKFNMKDHITTKKLDLKVYENAYAAGLIGENGKIQGNDNIQIPLTFELPLTLKDINKELGKERLDSALIENARFTSKINKTDLPLEWDWIDEVVLVLGNSVYRPAGNTMTVYRKGDGGGYGQKINTNVDDFSICLMKNRNMKGKSYIEYEQNVDSAVVFKVIFKFTVPTSAGEITIPKTAQFNYNLEVEFIDYKAIWGFFDPSKDMISKNVEVDLSNSWKSISFLKDASTPFSDPKIDVQIRTTIAGAMTIEGNHVYTINKDGDSIYATFKGKRKRPMEIQDDYLDPDPKIDPIGTYSYMSIPFDSSSARGRIDQLFKNMPQKIGYDFAVGFSSDRTPQLRITPDTRVSINAICTLPLKFRDGLFVNYSDTIKDVNLSQVSIDSLLREVEFIDTLRASDVNLYVTALNEIPLTVKAVFKYLDEFDQPIKDPKDPSKLFNPFTEDTLHIAPPRYEKNSFGGWSPADGGRGKTLFTAAMTKEKLDVLPKIKKIVYTVIIDNDALNYAFKQGLNEVPLTEQQRLELSIGITAHVDAIMNLNK